jgi:hypothetical protein
VGSLAKVKKTLSQAEANAYKTKAEGKAIQVNAWMPLMLRVVSLLSAITLMLLGL